MLYHLLVPLSEDISVLNVFRYITFRSGSADMTTPSIRTVEPSGWNKGIIQLAPS